MMLLIPDFCKSMLGTRSAYPGNRSHVLRIGAVDI